MTPETLLDWLRAPQAPLPLVWTLVALALWPARLLLLAAARRLLGWRPPARLDVLANAIALPAFLLGLRSGVVHMLDLPPGGPLDERLRLACDIALWLVAAWLINRALDAFVWSRFGRQPGEPVIPRLAVNLAAGAVYAAAVMGIVAVELQQPLTGLLVSSSVVAAIIGLALQGTLTDLMAGIAISVDEPYRIGDWLEVEGGIVGKVVDITWRSTRLLSWNDSVYVIPNSQAAKAVIHNLTEPTPRYGYWFAVFLPAEVDPKLARRVMLEACLSSPEVLADPAPTVRLRNLGHTPMEYRVFVYFRDYPNHFEGLNDLQLRIWTQLERLGIEPAAPIQDLRLRRGEPERAVEPQDAELLKRVAFLGCLGEGERQQLLADAERRTYRAGEVIVREGDQGSSLFVIVTGVARVTRQVRGAAIEITRLSVYDYFGEMSVLTGEPRSATVTALTDCKLLCIEKAAFDEVIRARPRIVAGFAEAVSQRRDRAAALVDARFGEAGTGHPDYSRLLVGRIRSFFGLGAGTAEEVDGVH